MSVEPLASRSAHLPRPESPALQNGKHPRQRGRIDASINDDATILSDLDYHVAVLSMELHWEKRTLETGTVKWFNAIKCFGFIQPDDVGNDVFVPIFAVKSGGLSTLN